jgi:hypothetical protein
MMYENNQQMPGAQWGNYNIGNAGMQFGGVNYNQAPQQKNVLTAEEISMLMKKENQFTLVLSETDKLKAFCTHKLPQPKPDGTNDSLVDNPDGTCTCSICGYTFRPINAGVSTEELNDAVSAVLDVLQTIKMIWIDIDPKVVREYFQIIPLLEKIPHLFDIAVKNYSKHENFNPYYQGNDSMGTMQVFSMLSGMLNGQNPGGFQQPQMNPQMNMGGYYQQPVQPQPMAQPYAANGFQSNGFGYAGPQAGYQPQTAGYQTTYGQPQPQAVAPQQPVTPQPQVPPTKVVDSTATEVKTSDGNTVTAEFKA